MDCWHVSQPRLQLLAGGGPLSDRSDPQSLDLAPGLRQERSSRLRVLADGPHFQAAHCSHVSQPRLQLLAGGGPLSDRCDPQSLDLVPGVRQERSSGLRVLANGSQFLAVDCWPLLLGVSKGSHLILEAQLDKGGGALRVHAAPGPLETVGRQQHGLGEIRDVALGLVVQVRLAQSLQTDRRGSRSGSGHRASPRARGEQSAQHPVHERRLQHAG